MIVESEVDVILDKVLIEVVSGSNTLFKSLFALELIFLI